jgi:hypothetical protein
MAREVTPMRAQGAQRPAAEGRGRGARPAWAATLVLGCMLQAPAYAGAAGPAPDAAPPREAAAPALITYAASEPFRDPGTPPALRRSAAPEERARALAAVRTAPRASGAALDAQVERKLRASFDAADVHHRGALTAAEARAGGFGYVANHFDAIDERHAGEVTFDDLTRYLRRRRAAAGGH